MSDQFQVGDRVRTKRQWKALDLASGQIGRIVVADGCQCDVDFGGQRAIVFHVDNLEPYSGHRIYLAGPMRGYEHFNFPMFDRVAQRIREDYGYDVFNPADLDRQMGWVNDAQWWTPEFGSKRHVTLTDSFDFETAMQRDLWELELCDEIVLLPGWSQSEGAQRELERAYELGLELSVWFEGDRWSATKSTVLVYWRDVDQEWLTSQGFFDDETYVLAAQAHIADVTGEADYDFSQTDTDLERLLAEEDAIANGLTVLHDDDPFEQVLMDVVATNRRKRADYALDGDPFSNFRQAAEFAGVDVQTVLDVMLGIKQARLLALAANDRGPQNESVYDSILDRAVYGVIALALANEQTNNGG